MSDFKSVPYRKIILESDYWRLQNKQDNAGKDYWKDWIEQVSPPKTPITDQTVYFPDGTGFMVPFNLKPGIALTFTVENVDGTVIFKKELFPKYVEEVRAAAMEMWLYSVKPEPVPDEADNTIEITLPRSGLKATIGLYKKE